MPQGLVFGTNRDVSTFQHEESIKTRLTSLADDLKTVFWTKNEVTAVLQRAVWSQVAVVILKKKLF